MSRIGKQPIQIPSGVTVTIEPSLITVVGPKGTLTQSSLPDTIVKQQDDQLIVSRTNNEALARSKHGLLRTLISNMIAGVSLGFQKQLEFNGVGYRVSVDGNGLKLNLGYSHEINFALPTGITASVDQNVITISGIDKQQVGQVAAKIRALKKPEPYKGKGIKYVGERIIRKSGKSGKEK
ncbi:50S ribosomal protein L6 [Candidatus Saccharibacteria bacterium]|nr:50S ribosomal protein L6 [Candidatus Saccharibacteria bacterium]